MTDKSQNNQEHKAHRGRRVLLLVIAVLVACALLVFIKGEIPGKYSDTLSATSWAVTAGWLCAPLLFSTPRQWKPRAVIEGIALVLYVLIEAYGILNFSDIYAECLPTAHRRVLYDVTGVLAAPILPGLVCAFFFYRNVSFGRDPERYLNPDPKVVAQQQARIRADGQKFFRRGKRLGRRTLFFVAFLSAALAAGAITSGHLADSPTYRIWAFLGIITLIWTVLILRLDPDKARKTRAAILAAVTIVYTLVVVYEIVNYITIADTTPSTGNTVQLEEPAAMPAAPLLWAALGAAICGPWSYLLFSSKRRARRFIGVDVPEQCEDSE